VLNKIYNERIFDELKKILSLKSVYNLFNNNQSKEIILNIFPELKYYERLNKISSLDKKLKNKYDNYLTLALLVIDQSNNFEYFCHKYKTSNNIENRFKNISKNFENLKNKKFYSEENIKKSIYFTSKNEVKDLLLFSTCINDKTETLNVEKLLDYVNNCEIPKFPISGDYLKKHGYETGQKLGKKLKLLKEKWIANNFVLDEDVLKKSLNKIN
jgi:tRNA nucleotidyltransferase/poly(A) polymerase